jgi:hypothetical protein
MVAPAELRVELHNLAQKAKTAEAKDEARLRHQLEELVASAGPGWLDSADMCAAIGRAHGELGLFAEAVRYYDKGRALQPADSKVESLEQLANLKVQLANLKVRWALKRVQQKNGEKDKKVNDREEEFPTEALFKDAEKILDGLLKIHETQERYALKGKIDKAQAMLSDSIARRQRWLEQMATNYGKGYTVGADQKRTDAYYPLQNRLAAEIVLSWNAPKTRTARRGKKKRPDSIAEGLAELETYAKNLKQKGQSFWDMVLIPDQQLLVSLYKQRITPNDQKEIVKGYRDAKRRGGSVKDMDSVIENIRFFEAMLGPRTSSRFPAQLAKDLEELRKGLSSSDDKGGKKNKASV